jgi:hypothetical protein
MNKKPLRWRIQPPRFPQNNIHSRRRRGLAPGVFAAGDETLKVALIGCGGRGSAARPIRR